MIAQCKQLLGSVTPTPNAKTCYSSYIMPYVAIVRMEAFTKHEPLVLKLHECVSIYASPLKEHMLKHLQPNETVINLLAAQPQNTLSYYEKALPNTDESKFTSSEMFDNWMNEGLHRRFAFQPVSSVISLLRCDVSEFCDLVLTLRLKMQGELFVTMPRERYMEPHFIFNSLQQRFCLHYKLLISWMDSYRTNSRKIFNQPSIIVTLTSRTT